MRLKIGILTALLLLPIPGGAASAALKVSEMVAGVGGEAVIEGLSVNTSGTLKITSPTSTSFLLPFTVNAQGTASVRVLGTQVQQAGMYTAALTTGGSELASVSFNVLADKLDPKRSSVTASSARLTPDGRDSVTVTVSLVDRFGNGLGGRPVELISSRNEDQIRASSSTTDDAGSITFTVKTTKAGSISLTAFDLLSALTLDEKATINADAMGLPVGADAAAGYSPYAMPPYGYMPPYYPPYPYMPSYPAGFDQMGASLFGNFAAQTTPSFGELDHFEIDISPQDDIRTLNALNMSILALDAKGRIVQDYTGTVSIDSTDKNATLPGSGQGENGEGRGTFAARNLGRLDMPLSVVFRTGGEQTIMVKELIAGGRSGEKKVTVNGSNVIPDANRIEITYPKKGGFVNSTKFVLKGVGPRFSNLVVKIIGAEKDSYPVETDGDGAFEVPITLVGQATEYLGRVQDSTGRYDSGDFKFGFKAKPAEVISVTFSPEKPQEGDSILVSVETETKAVVALTVEQQKYTLTEDATKPGTYRAAIKAPKAGSYQLVLLVTDIAENVTQQRVTLKVAPPGLAIVTGVKGKINANRVTLSWNPVDGADSYNIYVGKDPKNLLTIPTPVGNPPPTQVDIADLEAGSPYFFAVTALNSKDGSESVEKSEFVTLRPLGLKLSVNPETDSLRFKWLYPNDVPLAAFVLEYGVGKLSEKRLVNGEAREVVARDLIPGVTYMAKVTPVAVTGEPIFDQSAEAEGTVPTAVGFRPTPGETVTGSIPSSTDLPPPDDLHAGAPSTAQSGLPQMALFLTFGVAAAGALLFVYTRRLAHNQANSFLATMEQRYQDNA
jgi:hypothetical protein